MNILLVILIIIFGIIALLGIVFFQIYIKIKIAAKENGFDNLSELIGDIKRGEEEANIGHKHVTGQTRFLVPKIRKDFPNFSESELYNKAETSLRAIFNSLEDKNVSSCEELVLLREKLQEEIDDLKSNDINVRYDEVKFHEHALKYYEGGDGVLKITVSSTLEYEYSKEKNGKEEVKNRRIQTRYTTVFIYIYDPDKYSKSQTLIGINCPNCGAPVKDLGHKVCRYCGSGLEDINLKSWHIVSYESDY